MSKDLLEWNVLQAAISARRMLNRELSAERTNAYYELLEVCERVSIVDGSANAVFIGRMIETYKKGGIGEQMTLPYES